MAVFNNEATDDAARDACALLRAAAANDAMAVATVSVHLSDPALTAGLLARWFAEICAEAGIDLPGVVTRYQQNEGL